MKWTLISEAVRSISSFERENMERFTPSFARPKAIAFPIPLLDAATRATFLLYLGP